jgi:uncharacterized protein involved in response to NO
MDHPVCRSAFRGFFVLAAVYAVANMVLWLLILGGRMPPQTHLIGPIWHGHEMLFGYTAAVLGGFFLTAAAVWTGRPTAHGWHLIALMATWLAGRVMLLAPGLFPGLLTAAVDLVFLPWLALVLARPIYGSRSTRNMAFPPLILAMAAGNALVHLEALELAPGWGSVGMDLGLDAVAAILVIFGGRIVPLFTRNALPQAEVRSLPWADAASRWGMLAVLLLELLPGGGGPLAVALILVGLATVLRMSRWGFIHTLGLPILWVLHVGYLCVGLGLVVRGLGLVVPGLPRGIALHLLAVGGLGVLTLGMMARVTLGHTGRELVLHPMLGWAFGLVIFATVVRVTLPLVAPTWTGISWWVSGVAWALAFLPYLAVYLPVLLGPRVDGKPG